MMINQQPSNMPEYERERERVIPARRVLVCPKTFYKNAIFE